MTSYEDFLLNELVSTAGPDDEQASEALRRFNEMREENKETGADVAENG